MELDSLSKDVGVEVRDALRGDAYFTAYTYSGVTAKDVKNWIFFTDPKNEKKAKISPKIEVNVITESPEAQYNIEGDIESGQFAVVHAWLEKEKAAPLDIEDFKDNIKRVLRDLKNTTNGVFKSQIFGAFHQQEDTDGITWLHAQVRVLITFRQ